LQVQVALGVGNFISRQFTYSNGLITIQDAFAIGDFDPSVEKDATVRIKIKNLQSPISTEPTSSF